MGDILDNIVKVGTGILGRWKLYAGVLALAVLACGLAYCSGRSDGADRCEAKHAEIARKATEKARGADAAAGKASDATKGAIDAENDAARDAAKGSDDPLRDGLEALD